MSKDSKENHGFSVSVACEVGVKKALIIQHILILQRSFATNEVPFNKTWVKRSMVALTETYPYLTTKEIRGAIDGLERDGYIVSKAENKTVFDRTKSFQLTRLGLGLMGVSASDKRANARDEKANGASDKRANGNVTKGQMLNDFSYIVNNIVEGEESEKLASLENPPTPSESDNPTPVEAKEKKGLVPPVAAEIPTPAAPAIDYLDRPNAKTAVELKSKLSEFYQIYEREWEDGVLEMARGRQYDKARRIEIINLFCCHAIKNNMGSDTYQMLNAALQKWFLGQKRADAWGGSNVTSTGDKPVYTAPTQTGTHQPAYVP